MVYPDRMQNLDTTTKVVLDLGAFGTIAASIVGWLHPLAVILSIIWISIQIWESKTFGKLRTKFRRK